MSEKTYIGTYKVVRIYRHSARRVLIEKGLTRNEAMRMVQSFPNSKTSMVVFEKQFYADKYFV